MRSDRVLTNHQGIMMLSKYTALVNILLLVSGAAAIYFRVHPSHQTVVVGQLTVLRCQVDNQEGIHVYWRNVVSGEYLTRDRKIDPFQRLSETMRRKYRIIGNSDEGEYNLMIRRISLSDGGRYACVYFTDAAYTSQAARIRVLKPPDKGFPSCFLGPNLQMDVGENITLVCESQGGDPPATLTWIRGKDILESTSVPHATRTVAGYEHTLTEADRDVRFTCVARNQALAQPRSCYVIPLRTHIEVILRPVMTTIYLGDSISFNCISENVPHLSYYWSINGRPIVESTPKYELLREGMRLRIVNATLEDDASVVICQVKQDQLALTDRAVGQLWVRQLKDNLPEFISAVLTTAPATTTPMVATKETARQTVVATAKVDTVIMGVPTQYAGTTETTNKPIIESKLVTTAKPFTSLQEITTTKQETGIEPTVLQNIIGTAEPKPTRDPTSAETSENEVPGLPGPAIPIDATDWNNILSGLSERAIARPNPNAGGKNTDQPTLTSTPSPTPNSDQTDPDLTNPAPMNPDPTIPAMLNEIITPQRGDVPLVRHFPRKPATTPKATPTTIQQTTDRSPERVTSKMPTTKPTEATTTQIITKLLLNYDQLMMDNVTPLTKTEGGSNAGVKAGLTVTFLLLTIVGVGTGLAVYYFKFRKPPQK